MSKEFTTRDLINHLQILIDKNAELIKIIHKPQILLSALEELDSLIEMNDVKKYIIQQVQKMLVIAYSRNNKPDKYRDRKLHTILMGPPGVGKTKIALILAKIWEGLGVLDEIKHNKEIKEIKENCFSGEIKKTINSLKDAYVPSKEDSMTNVRNLVNGKEDTKITLLNNIYQKTKDKWKKTDELLTTLSKENEDFKEDKKEESFICIAKRSDVAAEYQGQTDPKCRAFLDANKGKVIIFDECYNLWHDERDHFGMEALTMIVGDMDVPDGPIFIFAGYEDYIKNTILKAQPGLMRRFKWKFIFDGYTPEGLSQIFTQQLKKQDWILNSDIDIVEFFKRRMKEFPAYGGDTLNLMDKCELQFGSSIFPGLFSSMLNGTPSDIKLIITESQLNKAFEVYKINRVKDEELTPNLSYFN